jgi:uncharacterized protein DUF6883
MKLPNPHKAVVDIAKLRDYSLNLSHSVGRHKARVFRAALGLSVQQAAWLRERALELAVTGEATAGARSVFGDKYVIDAWITYKDKTALVRFSWIVDFGTDFPRLTSCYVR